MFSVDCSRRNAKTLRALRCEFKNSLFVKMGECSKVKIIVLNGYSRQMLDLECNMCQFFLIIKCEISILLMLLTLYAPLTIST